MKIMNVTPSSSVVTDSDLVQATLTGNVDAFGELISRYDRMIFHIAQCITRDPEDAKEAVQEACLKAYKKLEQFKGVSKFSTWLIRITMNEALAKMRRRRRTEAEVPDEEQGLSDQATPDNLGEWGRTPEQLCYDAELKKLLANALQSLGPGIRTVFWLRYVEGLSTQEVAQAMSLTLSAVKARLFRARTLLRSKLGKLLNLQQSRRPSKRQSVKVRINGICSTAVTVDEVTKAACV
jgi:RNA polymerase sigma-70 factor, ECF subfamily